MDNSLEDLLYIYALQNAVKHESAPKSGTVIGTVLGKHPEFRSRARELGPIAGKVIAEVAAMTPAERKSRLEELAPELLAELTETHEHIRELPALEGAENGVVMRFAPNPSGPLHLGHARASILNDYYVKRYGGRYVLRIEDTDPKRVDPEAYDMVREDVEWLGLGITDIVYQSDRLDIYYDLCRKLIELGGAYVCVCEPERFRELKLKGKACPCREQTVEENLELWQRMLDGEFYEGDVTVRVKTDLTHPDPAIRDYSAMRIVSSPPHPRVDATVFPLMNFSVAVDDHLLGITHVIRGKDHIANTRRQRYIFDYFGWKPPVYRHYGRMGISGVVLSTSGMREGIKSGLYTGWDDIHLGTLRAIARRGIEPDAVRNAMIDIGIGETDISFSWENLYARNKEIVDPKANRYFFVPDPVEVTIEGAPHREAHASLHPSDPSRGVRTLVAGGKVLLPRAEIEGRSMVRLKDLYNVRIAWDGDLPHLSYAGDSLDDARSEKAPIIQWLPAEAKLPCTLLQQEGSLEGFCEPRVAEEADRVVQFERIGFARIDSVEGGRVSAYFAHR
ncbi:glutamate--tRNA ligase [Methanoculleus thermophilus]|uniref:Glutamate--tRNA ligase n=1 Tax=Methanoculleus thermophilus TaxID=2200 RepID=A0A1G9C3B0_9EURY|nr:glutamate--tRNA ligase [Methanoculleus thermophilus]SDK45765.1 glutamyl-tRNA synthetase [Methanoculleus thermophilus]